MTVKRGTFEFPFHRHDGEDINQSPNYRFVTDVQIARWNSNAGGTGEYTNDPQYIAWNKNYRAVTDIQIQAWNNKANTGHSHTADTILETSTKTFITPTERTNWNAARELINSQKAWDTGILSSNADNEIKVGNKQTHQYFIFRFIAKTAAGTEAGQIDIESDPSGVRIIGMSSMVYSTTIGIGNINVAYDSEDNNIIKLIIPIGNSVVTVFRYNIEKISL